MSVATLKLDALKIFYAGLNAVDPKKAVLNHVRRDGRFLVVDGKKYCLSELRNIYIIGAGKAGASMALAMEEILDGFISEGFVNVKYGYTVALKKIRINEAGHPVPDESGSRGAEEMVRIVSNAMEDDLVICLISGGGSALFPLPAPGISLNEKQEVTKNLLACGASINEINAVRKHISRIKGGQLARLSYPATLITFILSDVIGNPLDVIASGPTVPDSSTFDYVREILERYNLWNTLPITVRRHIDKGMRGEIPETPKKDEQVFSKTQNVIVGSNIQAVLAAAKEAKGCGYNTMVLSSFIEGETKDVSRVHAAIAKEILQSGNPVPRPACIVSGGETTVTIRGSGKGGRNQEFCLAASLDITGLDEVVILSGGTDGTDGLTDAAGAICDGQTVNRALEKGMKALNYLLNNNSYHFFKGLNDLIITGPTNTNVMDLRLILVG